MNKQFDFVIFLADDNWNKATRRAHYEAFKTYGNLLVILGSKSFFTNVDIKNNINIITPSYFSRIIPNLLWRKINKLLKNKPVIIYAAPWWKKYFKILPQAINIFEANDLYSAYPHLSNETKFLRKKQEKFFAKNVDIILTTSYFLYKKYKLQK